MALDGFVNIIKPTGMTSSDVVIKIKKILKTKKVGHLGTLDPAASGVLPVSVGRATKFFDYFLTKDKEYYALVQFGYTSDTLDSFGQVEKVNEMQVTEEMINGVISKFTSEIEQIPPKYSAIKINGKKACDLARENVDFELKPRKINIYSIILKEKAADNKFLFKVHCSAGTYIRTLFADIAEAIGAVAIVPVIIRSKSGLFNTYNAITLEELEEKKEVLLIREVFKDFKFIEVEQDFARKIINGLQYIRDENNIFPKNEDFFITLNNVIVGLFYMENGFLRRKVFIYNEG